MTPRTRSSSSPNLLFAVLFVGLSSVALSGCFLVESAVETGVNSAAGAAGEEVGEAVGQQLAPAVQLPTYGTGAWNRFMVSQAQVLFSRAFTAGGMWPAQAFYAPGEWARYQSTVSGESSTVSGESEAVLDTLERAYLKETEDGSQWWREASKEGRPGFTKPSWTRIGARWFGSAPKTRRAMSGRCP